MSTHGIAGIRRRVCGHNCISCGKPISGTGGVLISTDRRTGQLMRQADALLRADDVHEVPVGRCCYGELRDRRVS